MPRNEAKAHREQQSRRKNAGNGQTQLPRAEIDDEGNWAGQLSEERLGGRRAASDDEILRDNSARIEDVRCEMTQETYITDGERTKKPEVVANTLVPESRYEAKPVNVNRYG
ncbi:hypothetical protein FISHEDRAFT_60029 [Fistulina hepatica ATCC 64428]|uniref:Uncharacterized protein n=1 Tax=Fistulina hepatica ATCC 64428 TaxID=1128425 RepID=A0A0D7A817_9AGAR|nr:hypothetical protein FISHEDRAFT_60029 [Fistulina hepatica ATCC 64428]